MSLPPLSKRIRDVQEPVIPIVGQLIREHPGTISLGQGIVHYPPPPAALAELQVVPAAEHRYGDVRGSEALLDVITKKLSAENAIDCEAAAVVYTAGSNMGFLNAVLAIGDVGDEFILISPYYFNHDMAIEIAGCRTVTVPARDDYGLDLGAIEAAITARTKAIVTVSPNNPTGAVYSRQELTAVNQMCAAKGIYHISDEAYEYFVYGDACHFSPGSLSGSDGHTISLYTLSKSYGMAGWRCGYMVVPEHLLMSIKKVQDTNLVCPPMMVQRAAAAAISCGKSWCLPKTQKLSEIRKMVLGELQGLSRCSLPTPDGAFYLLMQIDSDRPSMDLVEALIRDHAVAVLPGTTFGLHSKCAVRISYGALERGSVMEGIGRLKTGLLQLI